MLKKLTLLAFLASASICSYAQSSTVELWFRAFIPSPENSGAASSYIKTNPLGGSFVKLRDSNSELNACFRTDHRGFSNADNVTSRLETRFTVKLLNGLAQVSPMAARSSVSPTTEVDCASGAKIKEGNAHLNRDHLGNPAVADGTVQVIGQAQGTNVLTILGRAAPSIDYNFDIQWKPSTATLIAAISYGAFPALELYARQPGGEWTSVIKHLPTSSPWSLAEDVWGVGTDRETATVVVPGMSGKWQVTSDDRRFTIEVSPQTVKWSERSTSGVVLTREVPISELATGALRIDRPNDNDVLTFLGFQQSLRNEILARNPQPSFIVLSWDGKNLRGEWNGLLAIKDNNGHLQQLVQPGARPPKVFTFTRLP